VVRLCSERVTSRLPVIRRYAVMAPSESRKRACVTLPHFSTEGAARRRPLFRIGFYLGDGALEESGLLLVLSRSSQPARPAVQRGADVRPDWDWDKTGALMRGY
jgi:hypothetical protein